MRSLTIGERILASFGIVIAVVAAMGVLGYMRLSDIEAHSGNLLLDALPGVALSSDIYSAAAENHRLADTVIQSEEPQARADALVQLHANRSELDDLMGQYHSKVIEESDRAAFETLRGLLSTYLAGQDELLAKLATTGITPDIDERFDSDLLPQHVAVLSAVDDVIAWNHNHAIQEVGNVTEQVEGMRWELAGTVILVILIAAVFAYLVLRAINRPLVRLTAGMEAIREGDFTKRVTVERRDELGRLAEGFNRMADDVRELVGRVQKTGIQVNSSVTEIAATSKQQQATAGEIAATTVEIGATSKEISATSKELARTMGDVAGVAEQAATLAGSGRVGLSHMEDTMRQVTEAARSINSKLADLNDKAANINQVVTTITKVADQTNLLSLNAAIEAEKAGEYGRGFAVVAAEIRRLADQTAVATYDIEQTVKEIQSAISAGVMGMDKFAEEVRRGTQNVEQVSGELAQIIERVQELVPNFETVNEGMKAQATGAEQISEALLQLTEAAQQTVDSLQQSNAAIDDLNQLSGELRSSVTRFKLAG